ncbi:MAG: 8-amino-7-oxononanoate synthase [Deltaproteobacteria bacterium]|nr:8-amino-7-oxononanoate synthase [Deltaproteobacteria bacterium]MBM4296715.1 8-amino-7-oxononanoate synthase [Deltaproteobacteria bacterium]
METGFLQTELQKLRDAGLYRSLRRVDGDQGPTLVLDGREVINFSSNNYLGIANHPTLCAAAKEAIDRYGCGSGASRLISGNMTLHEELEAKLAAFKGTEAALVFNSGFQANTGMLSTLAGDGDVIFSDSLNHASIIDGCRLSRAKTTVYGHCDLDQLESGLKQANGARRKLIITESIFSMDGDEAPLVGIVELAEKHGAAVMVDEAHGTGVFGSNGAGVVAKLGLGSRVLVQMGTLGKALGGFGAYVAGSKALRELLINRCRSFIFTTSLPPAVMAMALAALDVVQREPERRAVLLRNCQKLKQGLAQLGFQLGESESSILPLIVGDASRCMDFSAALLAQGVFAQGIRPPTVPAGTSRLRITCMATHTDEQVDRALSAFKNAK